MPYPQFVNGDILDASDMNAVGLWLVKSETIGSGVSSVAVTDAFSADYDSYRVIVTGGATSGATATLLMTLGATATGYYWGGGSLVTYGGGGQSPLGAQNGASWNVGRGATAGLSLVCDIMNPFVADETYFFSSAVTLATGGELRVFGGYLANSTSYTDFTVTTSTGTITGGTIRVYGYRN